MKAPPLGVNVVGQALTLEGTATVDPRAQPRVSNTQTMFTCNSNSYESTARARRPSARTDLQCPIEEALMSLCGTSTNDVWAVAAHMRHAPPVA